MLSIKSTLKEIRLTFLIICAIIIWGEYFKKRCCIMAVRTKLLIFFSIMAGGILLISNIAAVKIWDFFGIPVDGGIILFPLSYILTDLTVEFFGSKKTNYIILSSFTLNAVAVLIFFIVGKLPSYNGWGLQEAYDAILGFVPRIILGSLLAYVLSSIVNNFIFEKMRNSTIEEERNGKFWYRAIGSSAVAHILDSLIFELVAFCGVLPMKDFIIQAVFAYVASMMFEIFMSPITLIIAGRIRKNF